MQKYRVRVSRDDNPENPRAWDNVATMVCWHSRYNLGDEQPECTPAEYRRGVVIDHGFDPNCPECKGHGESEAGTTCALCEGSGEATDEAVNTYFDDHFWELPLYLYDHSGITISTGKFSCPWDSGQVGFVYVSMERALEEWGTPPKDTPEHEFFEQRMRTEVKVYDQYLTGDVYGFELERLAQVQTETRYNADGSVAFSREVEDWEDVSSCWGFFGDDPMTNGMADHFKPSMHEALVEAAYYQNNNEWIEFELPEGEDK